MDCNKEEALRAKDIAEKKLERRDFFGARKIALKAQQLYPDLENIAQMLVVCDVHCSAEQKVFGNEMDWYGILQVEQTAGDALIKKQYRKLALQLHPDKNNFVGAEAAFKLIGEAQRFLSDREQRSRYDMKIRVNKTSMPHHNQQKAPMNFSSTMKTNVRPNSTNSNTQQQQQQQQQDGQSMPQQPKQNGARRTFWTACPFCSVKYQYYIESVNRTFICQHCNKSFIGYNLHMQGTSPTTNSSQQAFGQQKDGPNNGTSKVDVGSQSNLRAKKTKTGPCRKKTPVTVSGKSNVKRKRNQVKESCQSSDSTSSYDCEGDKVARENGFPGVENHSTERPRRSVRQKSKVFYEDNLSDNNGDFLRSSNEGQESGPCGNGQHHGETAKTGDQNGLAAELKDEPEKVKSKQYFHSEESLLNRKEETVRVGGKETVGGSKQMDETSEHSSPNPISNTINHATAYVYPEAEFSDFDKYRKKECFAGGQIWAIYDPTDGMPRYYAFIRKVLSPGFKLQTTWLEPHPDDKDEINCVKEELPVACGKFKPGDTEIIEDHLMFSHPVMCEKIGRNTFQVYPRKEETWALYKNWDLKWYMGSESHKQFEYEFVEILSDYVEGEGVYVAYLGKLKGSVSLFFRITKDNQPCQIPSVELFRFSHKVPSFRMTGQEGAGVHMGYLELDPASLPVNLEEIAIPENLDVKIGHSSSGIENAGSSERSKPLLTPDLFASIHEVNSKRGNMTDIKDSVDDDVGDYCASPASIPETFQIPDTQFFNFDAERSLDKFKTGQIWAFYSDEDELPKYYGWINKIETSPDLELNVSWLACCWLPKNTTKWEDEDMPISCGRFKVHKTAEFLQVYNNTHSISHQVQADAIGKNYAIHPRKGEVWALYRKWSNKIKPSDLKNWEYDLVEVLEETDLFIEVLVLEHVSGFNFVFRGKSNEGLSSVRRLARKELLMFSHQIPAFKLTEEHGNLRGFWELDPGALPRSEMKLAEEETLGN